VTNTYFYILIALIAGAMIPTQAAVNNKLALVVSNPVVAAFVSFVVGTLALFVYLLFSGIQVSSLAALRNAPLVAWTGGLLGAFFVASSVFLLPKLGVALTFSLIIASQMFVTLVIDHFGLLGLPVKEANMARVAGILLVVAGVIVIRKY
jgi:bacterial/archaeal transporter family-2 protein